MDPKRIVDQVTMEEFFKKHIALLPDAVELKSLRIHQHDPSFVLDRNAVLAEYKITVIGAEQKERLLVLRGSSDLSQKRQKHYQILQALREAGFDSGENRVARPIGYFPDFHLLLYENVPGQSLYDKFQYKPAEEWEKRIWQAIDWLIEFHNKKPMDIPEIKFDWGEERAKLQTVTQDLIKNSPDDAPIITAALQKMFRDEERILEAKTFHIIHGDFQPHNIIFSENPEYTVTIDFNDALFYDELYDLAYFTTQTKAMLNRTISFNASALVEKIIDYYLTKRKIQRSDVVNEKLAIFRLKTLMHIKSVSPHKIIQEIEEYAKQ